MPATRMNCPREYIFWPKTHQNVENVGFCMNFHKKTWDAAPDSCRGRGHAPPPSSFQQCFIIRILYVCTPRPLVTGERFNTRLSSCCCCCYDYAKHPSLSAHAPSPGHRHARLSSINIYSIMRSFRRRGSARWRYGEETRQRTLNVCRSFRKSLYWPYKKCTHRSVR